MNTNQNQSPFGEVIYSYTRSQAVADGVQVDVSKVAAEAGIRFPVFLTRTVFDAFVTVPEGVTGQDEAGRLWDVVWMLRFGIIRSRPGVDRIPVAFYVRNDNRAARLVKLIATCGTRHGRPAARHHRDDAGRRLTAARPSLSASFGERAGVRCRQIFSRLTRSRSSAAQPTLLGTHAIPKPRRWCYAHQTAPKVNDLWTRFLQRRKFKVIKTDGLNLSEDGLNTAPSSNS